MPIVSDLAQAARRLRRAPGHTALGALILALALGFGGALVAVVRATLLEPLPYDRPDEVVALWEVNRPRGNDHNVVSPANFLDWRDRASSFSGLALYTWSRMVLTGDGSPEQIRGRAVTPNLFDVLGVRPIVGRGFLATDADSGAAPTMLLSWALWQRRYGGRADVVGRTVATEGGSVQIIGVMPKGMLPLGSEEYWEPFRLSESMRIRRGRYTMALGRLRPGVTLVQAQDEMSRIGRSLEQEYPDFNTGWGVRVMPLREDVVGDVERPLTLLLLAVTLLLVIAASNLGNLLLVRADARSRDFAVARAMGASRGRVMAGWLAESLLLALLGAGGGTLLAAWGIAAAPHLGGDIPRIANARLDAGLVAGIVGVALALGALLGYTSLLGALRGDTSATLRASGRVLGSRASRRFRAALVAGQVALTLVLLHGAGLLLRSFDRLTAVKPGFDAAGLLTAEVSLPNARYDGDARRLEFFDQLETRLRQDPSVVAVGGTNFLPFTGGGAATGFHPTDRPPAAPGEGPVADVRVIDEGYLPAMRVPLLAGRMFDATDRAGSTPVVLVSQRLAQAEWPGESPIGKRLRVEYFQPDRDLEVIGVVGDVLHDRLDEPASPTIYYSARQFGTNYLTIVVRAAGDPTTLAPAVTRAVHDLDPLLPVRSLQPMTSLLGDSLAGRRSSLFLLGGFALAAMLLAAVGLYGVLSQVVRLRSREIGIRLALGSTPAREQQAVLGGAVRLVGAGAVVGAIGAVGASLALRAFLFAIPPGDPVTVGLVLLGLALVAITASLLPARRAARVDPATALRAE